MSYVEGMRCLNCGQTKNFKINVMVECLVSSSTIDRAGSPKWGAWSSVECPKCGCLGTVGEFTEESQCPNWKPLGAKTTSATAGR